MTDELTALRRRAEQAEADAAALRQALKTARTKGYLTSFEDQALDYMITADHPGARLLAELEAAREVVEAARHYNAEMNRGGGALANPMIDAIEDYDATVKASKG